MEAVVARPKLRFRWTWVAAALVVLLSFATTVVQAYDFTGGAVSVMVLERNSISGEPITIGRSGVTNSSTNECCYG